LSTAAAKDRLKQNAPVVLLGVALLIAAAVLLTYAAGLTYFQDTWEFLMNRRGLTADAFLQPHNEHIVLIPVAIEQLLIRVFGMTSTTPEFIVLTAFLLATAALVFVYVRRRVGPWPALMAAVLLLFLGPAWQDLLWPFQIGFVGSILFGVAMLLALDRGDRRSDIAACVFLAISIGFSSLGLPFAVGAIVDVFQRRRSRGLRRVYVAAVPLLFYAAWYLGWGHDAESHLSLHNVLVSPRYMVEGISASLGSLLALATIANEAVGRSQWALPLLVVLVALFVYRQVRKPGISPRLWPVAASAAAFWLLAGFNYIPGREAYSSRYLYAGAAFVLLIAADLLKGVRLGRWALLVGGAVTLVAAGFNLVPLREGRDFFKKQTVLTRSDLAAIEIAQRTVEPSFALPPEISGTSFLNEIHAGEYLAAVREYGSPAYSPAELARAPEAGRQQADVVLAHALPVSIEIGTGGGEAARRGQCVSVPGGRGSRAASLPLRPGTTKIELASGEPGAIRLRRFALREYPLVTNGIPGGSTTLLRIPHDGASRPWRLQVDAAQEATVCG
jgi:membrane protein CcdC involved in cytochrome C biogenesis